RPRGAGQGAGVHAAAPRLAADRELHELQPAAARHALRRPLRDRRARAPRVAAGGGLAHARQAGAMKPSAIRVLLLDQPARLRHRRARPEAPAARLRAGPRGRGPSRDAVTMLLEELTTHNAAEEMLLEPLLSAGDAYAGARVARMHEEHFGEHLIMQDALVG